MTHTYLTVAVPIDEKYVAAVQAALDQLGNPASQAVRDVLRDKKIHFMSMFALRGDGENNTIVLLEASADEQDIVDTLVQSLGQPLCAVMRAAGVILPPEMNAALSELESLLRRNAHTVGLGLFSTPGLCFTGTPGMSVWQIREEYKLARRVRDIIETQSYSGTPLAIFKKVRSQIDQSEFKSLLALPSSPLLKPASGQGLSLPMTLVSGVLTFTWPYLLLVVAISIVACAWTISRAGWFAGVAALVFVLFLGAIGLVAIAGFAYSVLRRLERSDEPDDSALDVAVLSEIAARENHSAQNHLGGSSIMKPGWLRNCLLRIAFWVISRAASASRPGFLGELGTIHFARWVLLPKSKRLLFLSNYGGSWESYLEDFITQAHTGLTGVWSNTAGFPRTNNFFQDGATDGDRFKRWARRQQVSTNFWYSAYPHLTTARIRLNSAIRQGLACVSTEDGAAEWLACIGSRPRGGRNIEKNEVQTILFGGLKYLTHSCCLLLRLPEEVTRAKKWLAELEPTISFGEIPPAEIARLVAFTESGLRRLGCNNEMMSDFPLAFQEGMSAAHRAALLGDTGDDQPEKWLWGHGGHLVDCALVVYAASANALADEVAAQHDRLVAAGGSCVHQINLESYNASQPKREPFGFVDGISQPIIRGTRRWISDSDAIHVVEPGEFILGYLDNRGFFPNTPRVSAKADPRDILPGVRNTDSSDLPCFSANGTSDLRDFGRNGTFLAIRQLEQDVESFNNFLAATASKLVGRQGVPSGLTPVQLVEWFAAKIVGRWRDGTSIVRHPHHPGTGWNGDRNVEPDNSFLFGAEDPLGERCPFGCHIRRSNPRESFAPGSQEQLAITNRHRILRLGRSFKPQTLPDGTTSQPGLLFMCVNADLERQFEFIMQSWALAPQFHGLDGEVDPIMGRGHAGGRLTIPTESGPILVPGFKDFVTVRGGGYFFLPSRRALVYLSDKPAASSNIWKCAQVAS